MKWNGTHVSSRLPEPLYSKVSCEQLLVYVHLFIKLMSFFFFHLTRECSPWHIVGAQYMLLLLLLVLVLLPLLLQVILHIVLGSGDREEQNLVYVFRELTV